MRIDTKGIEQAEGVVKSFRVGQEVPLKADLAVAATLADIPFAWSPILVHTSSTGKLD